MRGAQLAYLFDSERYRIIPADAGSTVRLKLAVSPCGDHPPQMRGALDLLVDLGPGAGIIPADAGSTSPTTGTARLSRDHPSRCGEHAHPAYAGQSAGGSSPQMRGAQSADSSRPLGHGIIPADAGSTACTWAWTPVPRDHPRRCGEHDQTLLALISSSGSSPQMRGALQLTTVPYRCTGIIPADAGSTFWNPAILSQDRDHPRRCGEHTRLGAMQAIADGSSPQMRGALLT